MPCGTGGAANAAPFATSAAPAAPCAIKKIDSRCNLLTEMASLRKGSPAAPSGTGSGFAQEPGPLDGGGGSGMGWPEGMK